MSIPVKSNDNSRTDYDGPTTVSHKKRKPQIKRLWIKKIDFQTAELAENYLHSLKTWKKTTSYNSAEGNKVTYRCTAGLYRKNECPAGIYLLYHAKSLMVSLYETTSEHNYHTDGNRGLPQKTREIVRQLFSEGVMKPNAIIAAFQSRKLQEPDKVKLRNFLATLRFEKNRGTRRNFNTKSTTTNASTSGSTTRDADDEDDCIVVPNKKEEIITVEDSDKKPDTKDFIHKKITASEYVGMENNNRNDTDNCQLIIHTSRNSIGSNPEDIIKDNVIVKPDPDDNINCIHVSLSDVKNIENYTEIIESEKNKPEIKEEIDVKNFDLLSYESESALDYSVSSSYNTSKDSSFTFINDYDQFGQDIAKDLQELPPPLAAETAEKIKKIIFIAKSRVVEMP